MQRKWRYNSSRRIAIAAMLASAACAAAESSGVTVAPLAAVDRVPLAEAKIASPARAAWYQQAFREATSFLVKPIPPGLVPEADRGDGTYVEARGAAGEIVGYVRDVSGPASTSAACACSPLNVTLAFERDLKLRTLLAATPLEKKGHVHLTAEEMERLIAIAKAPADPLAVLRQVDPVIDAMTGATTPAYAAYVIPGGALTTQRVVLWVMQTRAMLEGAPAAWDSERYERIMKTPDVRTRAHALAELLAASGSSGGAVATFWAMVRSYNDALAAGGAADPKIEARLASAGPLVGYDHVVNACYLFAQEGRRMPFVERCLQEMLRRIAGSPLLARLAVAVHTARGEWQAAIDAAKAAATIDVREDPRLYLRWAQALAATQRLAEACTHAKAVYAQHALMPGAREALRPCGDVDASVAAVEADERRRLLASGRRGAPAPGLELEDDSMGLVAFDLGAPRQITVVVFFSTWCPHCAAELPRIESFWRAVQASPRLRERVRVLGVRTGVERESEPYPAFKKRLPLSFSVLTDATLSLSFGKFARAHGIPAALPTVAVIDRAGVTRFVLDTGDWRDTAKELHWAAEALLAEKTPASR